jgi:hypothetical protein
MTSGNTQTRYEMDASIVKTYNGDKLASQLRWADLKDKSIPDLSELTKVTLRCRIARNGQLLGIENKENLYKKFRGIDLEQAIGECVSYPSHPVKIGDSWDASFKSDLYDTDSSTGMSERVTQTYKYVLTAIREYKGLECAVIHVEGRQSLEKDSKKNIDLNLKGEMIVEIGSGRILSTHITYNDSRSKMASGKDLIITSYGILETEYAGSQMPKEVIEQDAISHIDPALIKSLNELRIPIVLDDRVKIGNAFYFANDNLLLNGVSLRLLKFNEDRIYLKDEETGIIYKIILNFRGEVTVIKPLKSKEG